MNPIGVYFTYWESDWKADVQYYIEKARKLGFGVLEMSVVNLQDRSNHEIEEMKKIAQENQIQLIFGLGFPKDKDVSSKDSTIRKAGIEFAKRQLELVYMAGSKYFGGITYGSWQNYPEEIDYDARPYWENSVNSVKEICKTAENFGINYCLECVNRFEGFLLNTAEDGIQFVKEVDSPAVGLLLDTFHMNMEEDSFREAILTAGEKLMHFHIGECNRKAPGKGRIPWVEVSQALNEIHYTGPIVMEPFVRPGGTVGKDIKIWHDNSHGADEQEMDQDIVSSLTMLQSLLHLNSKK